MHDTDTNTHTDSAVAHHCLSCEERAYRDGYVAGVKTVANKGKSTILTMVIVLFYVVCILYILHELADDDTSHNVRSMRGTG